MGIRDCVMKDWKFAVEKMEITIYKKIDSKIKMIYNFSRLYENGVK